MCNTKLKLSKILGTTKRKLTHSKPVQTCTGMIVNLKCPVLQENKVQAKLPDVNAALVKWRMSADDSYKNGDPERAIIAIANMNALLPSFPKQEGGKSYKVEVSTERYNELRLEKRTIECKQCNEQNLLNYVKQYEVRVDWAEEILSNKKTKRMWVCIKCEKGNRFSLDDVTVESVGEPYYFKVMPAPPIRQGGIRGRMTFLRDFEKWYSIAMQEMESQIGIYRTEYAQQGGELVEMEIESAS